MSFDNELGKITLYKGVFPTDCIFTLSRLAYEFNGVHLSDWLINLKVDCDLPLFIIFFEDYCDKNGLRFGHLDLIKDDKIYQSYLNKYRLLEEEFTEDKKRAIYEKNHLYFAFNRVTDKRSIIITQYVPPADE